MTEAAAITSLAELIEAAKNEYKCEPHHIGNRKLYLHTLSNAQMHSVRRSIRTKGKVDDKKLAHFEELIIAKMLRDGETREAKCFISPQQVLEGAFSKLPDPIVTTLQAHCESMSGKATWDPNDPDLSEDDLGNSGSDQLDE